jgi:hypothetical protein
MDKRLSLAFLFSSGVSFGLAVATVLTGIILAHSTDPSLSQIGMVISTTSGAMIFAATIIVGTPETPKGGKIFFLGLFSGIMLALLDASLWFVTRATLPCSTICAVVVACLACTGTLPKLIENGARVEQALLQSAVIAVTAILTAVTVVAAALLAGI